MKNSEKKISKDVSNSSTLTLGGVIYKTTGNILFYDDEESYVLAESSLLDKFDQAVQAGILENGMQTLFRKIKS